MAALGWGAGEEWVRALYAPLCHQRADRSLALWDVPLAVCGRCTGAYLGAWLGLVLVALRGRPWLRRGALALALAALPNLLDLAGGTVLGLGLATGPRAVVAFPLGVVLGGLLGDALLELALRRSLRRAPPQSSPDRGMHPSWER